MNDKDYYFMLKAIEQARKAQDDYGRVGSVLVQNDKIVSAAGSSSFVKPVIHAEHMVLEKAGWLNNYEHKKNSTIYVTLQPCIKRTSGANGCSFDIAKSGIERVVYGSLDSNFGLSEGLKFFNSRKIIFEQIPQISLQNECWEIFYKNNKRYE